MKHHRRRALARRSLKKIYLDGSTNRVRLKYLGSRDFMVIFPKDSTPIMVDWRRGMPSPLSKIAAIYGGVVAYERTADQ